MSLVSFEKRKKNIKSRNRVLDTSKMEPVIKCCIIGISLCYCLKTLFGIATEIVDRIEDNENMKKEEERDKDLRESCKHVYC